MVRPRDERYYRSPSRKAAPGTTGFFSTGPYRIPAWANSVTGYSAPTPFANNDQIARDEAWSSIVGKLVNLVPKLVSKYSQAKRSQDPLSSLLDQLQGMVGGGGFGSEDFSAQARADVAAQYDPQIAAINSAISRGRRSTEYNKAGIDSLYDALAASYPADIKASKETFKQAREAEKQISGEGSEAISAGYQQAQQNLADVMRQLGIEESAPAVLPELAQDQARLLAQEAARSTAEQSAYGRQGTAEQAYYQRGPSLARMGGTQGQQYLTEQFNQFLLDQQAQRAQLESQKALTYNALLGRYQSEYAGQQQQQQNTQFTQLRGLLDSILAVRRFQQESLRSPIATQPSYEGITGGATVLGEMVGQSRGIELQGILMDFIAEELSGPRQASFPEAVNMLRRFAQEQGLSSTDLNALTNALAATVYGNYR